MAYTNTPRIFSFLLLAIVVLQSSCRKEEFEFIDTPAEQALQPDSQLTALLLQTTMRDGSLDNIVDQASCLTLQFPYSVIVNNSNLTINTEADLASIEDIFDQDPLDTDSLEIIFPVTVIFADYSSQVATDQNELDGFAATCPAEGSPDPDIECIDLVYPVRVSRYNRTTESLSSQSFQNDESLYTFIEDLMNDDIVTLEFPIALRLADNTQLVANDPESLENQLDSFKDSCDEDDDFDYQDDDCNDCSPQELIEVFASCNEWIVESFVRGGNPRETNYTSYTFDFQDAGTLVVTSDTETFFGTWTTIGTGNVINITIELSALPEFNGDWRLNEIAQTSSEGRVNLISGGDQLTFDNACLSGNTTGNIPQILSDIIIVGTWTASSYMEGSIDRTADFSAYNFTFLDTGVVTADNGVPVPGTWVNTAASAPLSLNFGNNPPLDTWNQSWKIVSVSETEIVVCYIDAQAGGQRDILTFQRN